MKKISAFVERTDPSRRAFVQRMLISGGATVLAVPVSYLLAQVIYPTVEDHRHRDNWQHRGHCDRSESPTKKVRSRQAQE